MVHQILQRTRDPLSKSSSPIPTSRTLSPFDDIISHLIAVFPGMVNLRDFSIDPRVFPPSFDSEPLFSAAWSSFGHQLHRVSFGGNLEGYKRLISSNPPFKAVRELSLEFTDNQPPNQAADLLILSDLVVPFINNMSPHLRLLKVWSWASADLSSFFTRLGSFPELQDLSIRAPFNKSFRTDPSGLTQLLCSTVSTLRRLDLRLNPKGLVVDLTSERLLSEWMLERTSDEHSFSNLHAIQMYPTSLPAGFQTLLVSIQRSSETLTKLSVRERYLHHEEIESIVTALPLHNRLTSLRLNIWILQARVIDLLAKNLPCLHQLTLNIGNRYVTESDSSLVSFLPAGPH